MFCKALKVAKYATTFDASARYFRISTASSIFLRALVAVAPSPGLVSGAVPEAVLSAAKEAAATLPTASEAAALAAATQ